MKNLTETNNKREIKPSYSNNSYLALLLGLILTLFILFLVSGTIVNILKSPLSFISSCLFTSSLVIFYLDDYKLSSTNYIKYIQIFSFIIIPLYTIYCMHNMSFMVMSDVISKVKENDVNLHGHVNLDKDAAKIIGNSVNTLGSNIGLGASVAGISTAVGKSIAKSSIPPVQKAAIVAGGGLIGGLIHSGVSHINRANALENIAISSNKSVNDTASKLIDNTFTNPLEGLLFSIQGINSICFTLVVILIIQLFIRFYLKDTVNIAWLNSNFNKYLNKLIALNKKVSLIYIWLALIIILIGLASSTYFSYEIYNNMDKYIEIYNYLKRK